MISYRPGSSSGTYRKKTLKSWPLEWEKDTGHIRSNNMIRQSLEFMRDRRLPKYSDSEDAYEPGQQYVFKKKENATEPPSRARAMRKFPLLGQALEWARNNLSADCFIIVSV